jgi:endonuclease-8
MPEGPSLPLLKNQLAPFKGKVVKKAGGYGPMPTAWIRGKKLKDILSWGKHLLFVFSNGTVRVHLGLFGDILVNERKKVNRSFYLQFTNGEINGYVVKAIKLPKPYEEMYDWRTDIMSPQFDKRHVKKILKQHADQTIADVLLDQQVFTGVGNIIRIEALYRAGIHPLSITGKIPATVLNKLLDQVVRYARLFYDHLVGKEIKDFFSVYRREHAADGSEVTMQVLKKTKRKIYFSEHRQKRYG